MGGTWTLPRRTNGLGWGEPVKTPIGYCAIVYHICSERQLFPRGRGCGKRAFQMGRDVGGSRKVASAGREIGSPRTSRKGTPVDCSDKRPAKQEPIPRSVQSGKLTASLL